MILKGTVHKFGDDVNTDEIIPARYLDTIDPIELGKHCMEDADKEFAKRVKKGDIIVAGKNFGCGSSREHAPVSITGAGVSCVIARNFARIFYRNAINTGLVILELPEAGEIVSGDELEVDLDNGVVKNLTKNKTYHSQKFPGFMQKIINAGGLISFIRSNYIKK